MKKYKYINHKNGEVIDTDMEEEDALDLLPADSSFAMDLKRKYKEKKGELSESQLFWIMKLAAEVDELFPCDTTEMFEILKNGKISINFKELKIYLRIYPDGGITLNGKKFGKYTEKGLLVPGTADPEVINKFLLVFCKEGAAECFQRIGKKTGCCCYCGRMLTHEISIGVGYGPICAQKHSLPFQYEKYNASLLEKKNG